MMLDRTWRLAIALVAAVGAASCARNTLVTTSDSAPRMMRIGGALNMPAAPTLETLAAEQRFRFVSPDRLGILGITSEDIASASAQGILHGGVTTILESKDWVEGGEEVDFDISIFTTTRTVMKQEVRTEEVPTPTSHLPRCDRSVTPRPGQQCTNNPPTTTRRYTVQTPYTERRAYHVIRRRSDGAVRYWVHPLTDLESIKASVAKDLLKMLLATQDD